MASKQLILFFGGLALFAVLLTFGANFFLRRIHVEPPQPFTPLPISSGGSQESDDGGMFQIQKGTVDRRPVRYGPDGFSPRTIAIHESDDLGCLITVINQSDAPLKVGASPHDPAGDPGANYGEIAPGKAGVLDVRYSGLTEIMLHNHASPAHEFVVTYGPGCD
ncbi:MAG: hypothetical protein HY474_01225 [Candidatus Sungbacteria bacterium]|uniref:Uncharacterized protein n=1 Tax=Candidatus Sungiibacteriota bacterium TaxID=2750080 RepID=A0A932YVJ7_9BACT|nr:hypothetical protein [Candidatus Sungbacteria bacterium]